MLKRNLSDDNPEAFIEITGLQEEKETNYNKNHYLFIIIWIYIIINSVKYKNYEVI